MRFWIRGVRRFWIRVFTITLVLVLLTALALNALAFHLQWAGTTGSVWAYFAALPAALFLFLILLSAVWHLPMLFFRDDSWVRTLWRSLLLLLGHPAETLGLVSLSACLLFFYWKAPVAGLLLGGPLLMVLPCTVLEKLLWGYKIAFRGLGPEAVAARWASEAKRDWRKILKPWETR